MAATVQVHEMSATSTGVDKTSSTVRFKSADENTVDNNNRLQIPGAGTIYSYTKQLRLNVTIAPDTDVDNFVVYTDGNNGFGTGVGIQYDLSGSFPAQIDTNISGSDLFGLVVGTPGDMSAVNTGPYTGTGYKGDFIRMQMTIASTASPGTLTGETLTLAYDET